ncbi:MAG: YdcF family protein [Lachnospiraceae bacterium]|nr:YdcF family protein [Lachnospiraceae bacterium]
MHIRFDSIDRKPKLYSVLLLTGVTALVVAVLLLTGAKTHAFAAGVVMSVYFALFLVLLIRCFILQLKYNPYSYNTIFYFGFSLFLVFVLASFIILNVRMAQDPENYGGGEIVHTLLGTAGSFLFILSPFVLVFSVALCISNISLIRHEGRRFVNILGILLSFLLVGGEVFLFFRDYMVSGSLLEVMLHELFTNLFRTIYLYFICMLIGVIAANVIVVLHRPEEDKDFVIILGCRMRQDGSPTPLLRGRIERAIAFYRKQLEDTGKECFFVTSGGRGKGEVMSESACMKQYLLSQGIPERLIIEEDRSTNTYENMTFSKAKIDAVDPAAKVAFSTTNYHIFRSGLYARRIRLRAIGMGAKTKWYFWPNASVREFVGLLKGHRGKQLLILGSLALVYTVLTVLSYMVF